MPRKTKDGQPFDQKKYVSEWARENMGRVSAQYKKDFVDDFKTACKTLGISQSEVFRKAMEETIEQARESSSNETS